MSVREGRLKKSNKVHSLIEQSNTDDGFVNRCEKSEIMRILSSSQGASLLESTAADDAE